MAPSEAMSARPSPLKSPTARLRPNRSPVVALKAVARGVPAADANAALVGQVGALLREEEVDDAARADGGGGREIGAGASDDEVFVSVAVDVGDRDGSAEVRAAAQARERPAHQLRAVGSEVVQHDGARVRRRDVGARSSDREIIFAVAVEISRGHHRAEL
jgi:hypothetical protein